MFFLFERIPDYIKFKIKYNGYEQIYNDDCSVYTIKNKEEFTDYSFTFEVSVKKIENVIEYDVDGRLFYFKIDNEIDNFPEIIYSYKMPKFINLIYYTLITLTSITVIFNFIHFRFFYFFLFIFILFIVIVSKNSYSVSEQKKQDKISAKRKGNGKQLEMDI